jgi:hypothetical protein
MQINKPDGILDFFRRETMALLPITVALVFSIHAFATLSFDHWPDIAGPYLGQEPPGMNARIFAPGIISTDRSEINSVFAPDRDEFYFTVWTKETGTKIMVTSQIDGRWSAPEVASFSNDISDVDPAIGYDGERLFFSTRRPRPGESETRKDGFDMWFVERTESGWGKEQYLGPVVNSGESQVYPTVTRDGTLYFQAVREGGYGKADIYRSRLLDGVYQAPENLGPVINSENYEGDVFVAHDESYLIVTIYGHKDGFGKGDLYVSFRSFDGSWSPLKNMGAAINSDKRDFCPMVTPDGKYFFFSSKREGDGDIFWIDAKVIDTLRDE